MPPLKSKVPQKSRLPVRRPHGKIMSTLPKFWNKFLILGDFAILNSHYSQYHKRFKGINNQGASCCVMACAFSSLKKPETWIDTTIDDILILGTLLHHKTIVVLNNKCLPTIDPPKVFKYFFLGNDKITMKIAADQVLKETLRLDNNPPRMLRNKFLEFFRGYTSGIFTSQAKYVAVWLYNQSFFIFDPAEYQSNGNKWQGVPGMGYSYTMKVDTIDKLCTIILGNLTVRYSTKIAIYPCSIEKVVRVDTTPPDTIDGKLMAPPHLKGPNQKGGGNGPTKKKDHKVNVTKVDGDLGEKKSDGKIPIERPRLDSTTHFKELPNGCVGGGILHGTIHQSDPALTKYTNGEQSFANAVAALTILRLYKSKHWVRKIVDCTLRLGEMIYIDYKKLPSEQFPDLVKVCNRKFTPKIDHHAVLGRLKVSDEALLTLTDALVDFLIDNDGCIVMGPLIVAVWVEDNFFYMFDPNERDASGKKPIGPPAGFACVTWYESIQDLVDVYMSNVDKERRRDYFTLTKCVIEDFQEKSEPWNNFKALTIDKWILRGTFSQASRRFEKPGRNLQCTANATMALIYKGVKEVEEWDASTVDQVLISGDSFYRTTVAELEEQGKLINPLLMVDELKRHLAVENKQVVLDINDCLINGIVSARSDSSIPNLRKGFEEFFGMNEAGVLTSHGISVAFWKKDNTYYYYDSHSRDDQGTICEIGAACLLRMCDLQELTRSIRTNLKGSRDDSYNLSRIVVQLLETTDAGIVLPPLNHYEALGELLAILRSTYSESSKKFDLNRGKQTVAMCLAAIGFNALESSFDWRMEDLDNILIAGDKYYVDTLRENMKKLEEGEEYDSDTITSTNIEKVFVLGMNKITLDFEDFEERGNYEELKDVLREFYEVKEKEEGPREEDEETSSEDGGEVIEEKEKEEVFTIKPDPILIESEYTTVAIWGDDNLIYMFDPKPRDDRGQIYGKDEWSVKIEEDDEEQEIQRDDLGGGDNFGEGRSKPKIRIGGDDEDDEEDEDTNDPPSILDRGIRDDDSDDEENEEEDGENDEEVPPSPLPPEKKGQEYWHHLEVENGRGCVLRFNRPQDLIQHLIESTPPIKREDLPFKIIKVTVLTEPVVKDLDDPGVVEKKDEFVGDWNAFKECDYGRWILRGHYAYDHKLFPEINRGRQDIAMCLTAIAHAYLYTLSQFTSKTIDSILGYGDRLMTATRKRRIQLLKETLKIGEEDAERLASDELWTIVDYPRKICLGENRVDMDLLANVAVGDITASDVEDVLDLPRALAQLFDGHSFGVMTAKDISVAVWRKHDIYYMFDCRSRGPNGDRSPVGVSCITRFKNLPQLADLYASTLPKEGPNGFTVHALMASTKPCERPRPPVEVPIPPKLLGGFVEIFAGKSILRSDDGGDYTHYDRGVHVASSAVAFVALTMSLVQKPEIWTKLIVDEIMKIGQDLYQDSIRQMTLQFNPWTDEIDLQRVNNDFKVGCLQANCELRFMDQKGLVDTKDAKKVNLRQGIERFFDENTHGILTVDRLVLAIWEEEGEDECAIYLFDPNARGGTGMPMMGGTPCVLKFCNAKMASDHITASISGPDKDRIPFVITPVEVVIGTKRSCCVHSKKGGSKITTASRIVNATAECRHKHAQALEEKRKMRTIAQEEMMAKRERHMAALGRQGFHKLSENKWILRGFRVMLKDRDISTNIVASVMMRVFPIDKWTHKHIEIILNAGNQLHVDSTVAYRPQDPKLGFENVLRSFFIKPMEVQVKIFKPMQIRPFTASKVTDLLSLYFQQENFVMVGYKDSWVSVFFKSGYYYLFDPYARNLDGYKTIRGDGSAVLIKFGDLIDVGEVIVGNLSGDDDDGEDVVKDDEVEGERLAKPVANSFSMLLVGLTSVRRKITNTVT